MTPKQILDSFSETLIHDERILSAQERALVTALLQHAKTAANGSHETQETVRAVIASAIGETVAQRAFAVLGGSIVERILEAGSLPLADSAAKTNGELYAGPHEPQPPSTPPPSGPQPPGPQPPGAHVYARREPQPPSTPPPTQPQPPGPGVRTTAVSETRVAVAERPSVLPARCVVLDEFLAPQELDELIRFTLEHETDFSASEVVSPSAEGGVVNYEHRRSRVLMHLAHHQDVMLRRIKAVLPQVLDKLGMEAFSIADVEAQVTASNDGDFFRFHSDNGSERVASRYLTFVCFFHREPRQFEGGELRIHDARLEGGAYVSEGSYQTIIPRQNQMVFFGCDLLHEITPVKCSSQLFADSRFTLNGWLRR